ncbi:cation transporter, partial [Rhizobiaceae sp. 2RAB30]
MLSDGSRQTNLSVPGVHCANCIRAIEDGLRSLPEVVQARVNLTTRRVAITWQGENPPPMIETLEALGYAAHLFEIEAEAR